VRAGLALICATLSLCAAAPAAGQATVVLARVAVKDAVTYRFAEVFHESADGWIFPDIGYVDFGGDQYREFFAGFGRTLVRRSNVTVVSELYYLQAAGPASAGAKYVLPWIMVAGRPSPRVRGEAVYCPYLPLTSGAQVQHVLDRAKLEYALQPYLRVGGGYAAYQTRGVAWQNKPFLTMTVAPPRVGEFEFWLQRLPDRGAQVHVRYQLVLK
jgi:hypothetical protein